MTIVRRDKLLLIIIVLLLAIVIAQQVRIFKLSDQAVATQQNARAAAKAILQETAGALPEHNL